jgi:23S rRNA G2445 N2-methylase RlmL
MEFTILVLTDSGCEEACAKEIARWTKAKAKQHLNVVELKGSLDDAVTLGYHLQTARRVLVQLTPPLETPEEIEERKHDTAILEQLFPEDLTFKVEADVLGLQLGDQQAVAPDSAAVVDYSRTAAKDVSDDGFDENEEEITGDSGETADAEDREIDALDDGKEGARYAPPMHPQELIEAVGGWVYRLGRKVKLTGPDIIVYAMKTPERIWVGIDVVGRPLAKRDWRIMLSHKSLKATIAAATIIYSGAKESEAILDPLGDDGTIAIEAALLFTRQSPLHFTRNLAFERFPAFKGRDWKEWRAQQKQQFEGKITAYAGQMRELKAIRTNAKLAGIEKEIHATKVEMEWVETKFEENGIDRIITQPVASGKSLAERQVQKLNDELFYQAEYVLRKGRSITCITEKPHELLAPAEKYGFTIISQRDVLMGKRRMTIISFKNNKRKEEKEE